MLRSILASTAAFALVVVLASAALAAEGHGAEVSAVARAVHTTQGNAHGKAVSAIASAHGKEVSAAARARAAANKAAGKANGATHGNSQGKGNPNASGNASSAHDQATAVPEPGRIKAEGSGD
jgi:hypothetical protein